MAQIWARKSVIWLIIYYCNSLQLWINLSKGNLLRLHVFVECAPICEWNTFWFLPSFFFFFSLLKNIYRMSGCSEFEIIYYACFCKWVIWLLFPVLQLYLGFCKTSNGMWSSEVIYQFCHHCPCFFIIDLLSRFLPSKLTGINPVPLMHSGWGSWHSGVPITGLSICISANGLILLLGGFQTWENKQNAFQLMEA